MVNGRLKFVFNGQRLFTVNDSIHRMVEGLWTAYPIRYGKVSDRIPSTAMGFIANLALF